MTDDPKRDLTDDQLLTLWLDDDEPDYPAVTDAELSRLLHAATGSLGGGVSMSHDDFHMAMLRLIREIKRLRRRAAEDEEDLDICRRANEVKQRILHRLEAEGVDVAAAGRAVYEENVAHRQEANDE